MTPSPAGTIPIIATAACNRTVSLTRCVQSFGVLVGDNSSSQTRNTTQIFRNSDNTSLADFEADGLLARLLAILPSEESAMMNVARRRAFAG